MEINEGADKQRNGSLTILLRVRTGDRCFDFVVETVLADQKRLPAARLYCTDLLRSRIGHMHQLVPGMEDLQIDTFIKFNSKEDEFLFYNNLIISEMK